MVNLLEKTKIFFGVVFKTPKFLLAFSFGYSLFISVLFQHSLEVGIVRLILVFFLFKVTNYLIKNNPIYKKEIGIQKDYSTRTIVERTIVEKQNFLSKWIDSFIYTLGGERQTFHLTNVSYSFLVVRPTYFNFFYLVFCRYNKYSWFHKLFKIVLMFPHFITETRTGSFFFFINFFLMFFLQNIFSMVILVETYFLLVTFLIFFRFEGVYQYCIDTYGTEFVEKYIGNPLSDKFVKRLVAKGIVYTVSAAASTAGAVALNIADQSYHNDMANKEIDTIVARRQKLGATITLDELTKIEDKIRKENLTLFKQVTQTIIEFKKK